MIDGVITRFEKDYRYLSNFWPCKVEFEGIVYPSAEHAYQAAKTLDRNVRILISELPTAGAAKRFGRETIKLRPGWDKMKIIYMITIVSAKFNQNPDLMELLMGTKPALLIEGNTWGDTFWGECPLGNGKNHLGKILMTIRDDITRLT